MKKGKNKKAFTLVELIVVIVILATLATVAFVTLQDYPIQARDSKRTSDVRSISEKMSSELANGQIDVSDLVSGSGIEITMTGHNDLAGNPQIYNGAYGKVNYKTIKESSESFSDPSSGSGYSALYLEGGTGTGKIKCFEVASMKEIDDTPIVSGNCNIYYKMFLSPEHNDLFSLIDQSGAVDTSTDLYALLKETISGEWEINSTEIGSVTTCETGYHEDGGSCVSNTQVCSVSNGDGEQTWDESNSARGTCEITSCDSGYSKDGGSCILNGLFGNHTTEILDGVTGYYTQVETGLKWAAQDSGTNLKWSTSTSYTEPTWNGTSYDYPSGRSESQYPAFEYCDNLGGEGASWRLPTREELDSIITDTIPAGMPYYTALPSIDYRYYWSSTVYATYTSDAWYGLFNFGFTHYGYKTNTVDRVLCVHD